MSYTIVRTDGTVLTTIPDGIVNTTSTPLSLPGRNYPGYGQVMDNNFVRSLENFANTSVPANAIRGQLFFNTTDDTLYICPADGESDINNWYKVISLPITNLSFEDLTLSGDIVANNAYISNDTTSNTISTNYLTVNVNADINTANVSGVVYAGEANTKSITTGLRNVLGNIIGAWTVNGLGTVNSVSNTSLWVTGGNLVVTGPGTVGIRTDNYMWANGLPVSFDGTYSNTNVSVYLPLYEGNISYPGSGSAFNGNTISTGSASLPGEIIGEWTLSSGSKILGLTDIPGANVTGTVGNALIAQYANTAGEAQTVSASSQPNITSLGTLTALSVNGPIGAADITSTAGIFSGNAAGLYNIPIANLTGTFPTIANAVYAEDANVANTVRVNAQPNITSVGSLTTLVVSGNATFNGTVNNLGPIGNVRIFGGNAGDALATDGAGGLTWFDAGAANTAITVTQSSQPNITSVGTLSSLTVTGNTTSGNVYANSGTVRASLLTGTLTTASQPNITGVGTLSSLVVSGNAQFSGPLINLGPLANLRITGGTNGYALITDGAGSLSWAAIDSSNLAKYVTEPAQANITSVGILTSLNVTGNLSVATGIISGNGSGLRNLNSANISGKVANAVYADTAGTAGTASIAANATYATSAGSTSYAANSNYANSAGGLTGSAVIGVPNGGTGSNNTTGAGVNLGIIGVGQTWQNLTGSRAANTNYTNSTGRPIMVFAKSTSAQGSITALVNSVEVAYAAAGGHTMGINFLVPAGAVYRVNYVAGTMSYWSELR